MQNVNTDQKVAITNCSKILNFALKIVKISKAFANGCNLEFLEFYPKESHFGTFENMLTCKCPQ